MQPRLLAIVGPTGSGKTALALSVAQKCNGEIVSADSRQIYRYLDIGTAKPTVAERRVVKHHCIDILDPSAECNASQFGVEARKVIEQVLKKNKIPILVGGSGLYVKAAIDGLFEGPGKDPEIRIRLEERLREEGMDSLLQTLKTIDPLTLEKMKEITPRRVIRALEVYYISGKPISQFKTQENVPPSFEAYQVGLLWDRNELYQRINERVESMIASGLEDEVRRLIAKGYSRHLNALNSVGYKEVFDFIEGIHGHAEMVDLIKRNTRRFAKRQMTWFKRDQRIHWMRVTGNDWENKTTRNVVEALSARPRRRR